MLSSVEVESLLQGELLSCFDEQAPAAPLTQQRLVTSEDWTDVELDAATGKLAAANNPAFPAPQKPKADIFPRCDEIARPDELFLKPPYFLTVIHTAFDAVDIHCSHSPTLQWLADYLKKWCRADAQSTQRASSPSITPSYFWTNQQLTAWMQLVGVH